MQAKSQRLAAPVRIRFNRLSVSLARRWPEDAADQPNRWPTKQMGRVARPSLASGDVIIRNRLGEAPTVGADPFAIGAAAAAFRSIS